MHRFYTPRTERDFLRNAVIVSDGPLVGELSGKVGGVVFTKAKGGIKTVRRRVIPNNPRSAAQLTQRAYVASGASLFSSLTTSQVGGWNTYASELTIPGRNGQSVVPAGRTIFSQYYSNFRNTGGALGAFPLTPPTSAYTTETVVANWTLSSPAAGEIELSTLEVHANTTDFLVYAARKKNNARQPRGSDFRLIGHGPATNGTPLILTGIPAGSYFVRFRPILKATGQPGPLFVQFGAAVVVA